MLVLPIDGSRALLVLATPVPQYKDRSAGIVATDRVTGAPLVEVPVALTVDGGQPQVLRISLPEPGVPKGPGGGADGPCVGVDVRVGGEERPDVADLPGRVVDGGEARMTAVPDPRLTMLVPAAVLALAAVVGLVWLAVACGALPAPRTDRCGRCCAGRGGSSTRGSAPPAGSASCRPNGHARRGGRTARPQTVIVRELVPAIRVAVEPWGVRVDASTVGRLGVDEFQNAAEHLADVWRVGQVRVEQARPGLVRLRVLITDPLTSHTRWTDDATGSAGPALWLAGVDADGQPVTIRSSGVSGVVVAGLAGYGKTSFLNARFCQLAPSSAVQFVLIDGKGGPDYDDLFPRAWLSAKDDPQLVRDHLARVRDLMVARQRSIRAVLGVKNMWHVGPSASWPLVVVVDR